jgi:tetratricopeptide (TPR) repeat protein
LAKSQDLDRQPAATISFLCAALRKQAESDIESPGEEEGELGHKGFFLELDILRRAQRTYPADFWINHRLGISLIMLQSPDLVVAEGIGYMRAAVAVRPQSAHAMNNLGNGYSFLGELDQAIACFRKALELQPKYSICYSNLGIALRRKGLHEEAISAFEQAIKSPEGSTEAYAELSMILSNRPEADLRNPRRARELAERIVQLEPYAANYWTALGVARYRESEWQQARTALDRSLQLEMQIAGGVSDWETEAINWFFLAMSYLQMGQHDQARHSYDQAVEWMDKRPTHCEQLIRIRAEAEELLKIDNENKQK